MDWKNPAITTLLTLALREDQARHDVTTQLLISKKIRLSASLISKQKGVIAGLPLARRLFARLSRHVRVTYERKDGTRVKPGDRLLRLSGRARDILAGERPLLNAIQHLSGIATFTAAQVAALGRHSTRLYDTRKTLPGWRLLEKYAVQCGGGTNHRLSLGDAILVKENHIRICRLAGVAWKTRLADVHRPRPNHPIEVEVQSEQDLKDVLEIKPQRVLLDNFSIPKLRSYMKILRKAIPGVDI
jgi:nicotinate-nucleotide pyrophosphorylase (carboxylating)